MVSKNFDLKGFSKVEVGGAFEVDIVPSDSFQINVLADDFSHVRVEEFGGTLVIKRHGIDWLTPFHDQPKAKVALPTLTGLNVSGASRARIENFTSDDGLTVTVTGASRVEARNISAGKLEVKVVGASRLTGDIRAKNDFAFEASGASKVELTGEGVSATMKINGASQAELGKFPVQNASIVLSGASKAFINLNGRLDANVSGASSLTWSGSPVMGDIQTSGASSLHRG